MAAAFVLRPMTSFPSVGLRALLAVVAVVLGAVTVGCSSADPTATATPSPTPATAPTPAAGAAATPTPADVPIVVLTPTAEERLFLEIGEPENESVVSTEAVAIQGTTTPDAVVSVNGAVVDVDSQGGFEAIVTLEEGPNLIDVVASDLTGDVQSVDLVVVYLP